MILKNRLCGATVPGGLYATGLPSADGSLLPFTALVAPVLAEIRNLRAQQIVSISETLMGGGGLAEPTGTEPFRWKGLPAVGLADLWGIGAGYRDPWDVIQEVMEMGICRKVNAVSELRLPFPVLMMHMKADVNAPWVDWTLPSDPDMLVERLGELTGLDDIEGLWAQPFLEAQSLGWDGDDNYLWHPYVTLYQSMAELRAKKKYTEFCRKFGFVFTQGIFGLSWITSYYRPVKKDEPVDYVPDDLARQGVKSALTEDDPRAK